MEAAHENARTGDNSLFAEVVGSEQPTFSELTDLKVKSGQTYSLGVWIKVRNGTAGTVRLAIPGEHGEMLAEQAVPTRALPSDRYTRCAIAWTAPAHDPTADETIGFKLSVSSSDEPTRQLFVCFDDALLVQCDLAPEDQHPGYQPAALARQEFASVGEKIRYFLHEMTLEEKLLQMILRPPPDKATPGMGAYSQVSIPRLSLGGIRGTDGPRGPRPNGGLPAGQIEDGHNGPLSPTSLVWRPTGTRRCSKKRAASGGCSARNTA